MGRRDAVLLLLLVAIIFTVAALVGSGGQRGGSDPRASTYLLTDGGLRPLYWMLQEMDVPVERRVDALTEGDTLPRLLALMAPIEPATPAEAGALLAHVREGGSLIVAVGPYEHGGALYDSLGLTPRWITGAAFAAEGAPAAPAAHRWTAGVTEIPGFRRAFSDTSAALRRPDAQVLLVADERPVAVVFPEGRGVVLALADAGPLGTARLEEGGAAVVFARAAEEMRRGGPVVFSEYHHGFTGDGSAVDGLYAFLGETGAGHAALHLGAAMLLLLLVGARRFGAPLPPAPLRRRSPLEHVEALAGAYRQADARRTVRRLLIAGLARRLGRRAPHDEPAAGEMVARLARRSPVEKEAAAALEVEWKRGRDADLAALARDVDRVLDEVRRT